MKFATATKRFQLLVLALMLSVVAVSCVPPRIGTSWPALDTVNVNGEEKIFVAYNNQAEIVEPREGQAIRLLDAEGNPRQDSEGRVRTWVLNGGEYENAQFYTAPIQLDDDTLLLPDYNNRLLEINMDTVLPLNSAGISIEGHVLDEPAIGEDKYYVPFQFGNLTALDRETFDEEWTLNTDEGIWATPLLQDDRLYVTSMDHKLYALDADNGNILWTADLEGGITSTPLYVDGYLYVGSFAHYVYKIDADSGDIVANYETQNWVWSQPTLDGDTLYVTDLDGFVYALDVDSLVEIWAKPVGGQGIRPAPLVTEDAVIVASRDGVVHWLDPQTGEELFAKEVEGRPEILSDILLLEPGENLDIPESLVIISTMDVSRLLVAYSLDNGLEVWTYGR